MALIAAPELVNVTVERDTARFAGSVRQRCGQNLSTTVSGSRR